MPHLTPRAPRSRLLAYFNFLGFISLLSLPPQSPLSGPSASVQFALRPPWPMGRPRPGHGPRGAWLSSPSTLSVEPRQSRTSNIKSCRAHPRPQQRRLKLAVFNKMETCFSACKEFQSERGAGASDRGVQTARRPQNLSSRKLVAGHPPGTGHAPRPFNSLHFNRLRLGPSPQVAAHRAAARRQQLPF